MSMPHHKSALVISAHSADFAWRAGGAIASHVQQGWQVRIVCLSFGDRSELAKLWRQSSMTLEQYKAARRDEAQRAADILGCEIEFWEIGDFWDIGDYPVRVNDHTLFRLVDLYRTLQPSCVLSHPVKDPCKLDHPLIMQVAQEARIIAQAEGYNPGERTLGQLHVYAFEPHRPKQCGWEPNTFLDITDVWDTKRRAIECLAEQEHLWDYYSHLSQQHGMQARRCVSTAATRDIEYAEGFMRVTPGIVDTL